ncbi:Bacterial alpha-L-rhamnosidase [Colwellia demingiae]|uniref:alpha-L-rhamnosidase n=1 Tax=Colwellia demingiae TaxID=89401 RepID=A0A5C6QDX7_9GAMM|nr:alpha-L-rhamnosidase [Colwellia demingiae]TWX66883.1 Bacterial alpha-L-rhamnosidase [Colwellia demingiae]
MKIYQYLALTITLITLQACNDDSMIKSPIALTVNEGIENPLGFHDATPTFSWQLNDQRQGAKQTAYQLVVENVVGTSQQPLWDSQKVALNQSVYVPYQGPELKSRQRISWKVRYWDQNGKVSSWSTSANLELGLLNNTDWQASWVTIADPSDINKKAACSADCTAGTVNPAGTLGVETVNPAMYLRKTFNLTQVPSSARLYLTAKGLVDFRINGQIVTPNAFLPGWTDYTQKIETLTYDVSKLMREGENVLAARISDGWYAGTISKRFYGKVPELLAQLEFTSATGEIVQSVVTDASWMLSTAGAITMADIWHGEDYDARKELTGWDQPDYSPAKENAAVFSPVAASVIDNNIRLTPKRFQGVKVIETLNPISHQVFDDGKVVYDLGQNMVGWVAINLPALKGNNVKIQMAEMLNDDGTLYRGNYRAARSEANYIPAKDGIAQYTQTFSFFGFRYVQISGFDASHTPNLDWVKGQVLHTDFKRTGHFESSHKKLNKLYSNIIWGQRGNFLDIPTDCPQRDERYGWTGDAQVFAPVSLANYDTHAFWMSYLETMQMEMKADGSVPQLIPSNQYGDWVNAAGWGDAAFVIPWQLYLRTGDIEVLKEFYPMMEKRVNYYRNKAGNGLVEETKSFGDWLQPKRYKADSKHIGLGELSGETSIRLLTTSYYGYGAFILAQSAQALGKVKEAEQHQQLFEQIAKATANTFFDKNGKLIEGTETQTAYVLPLAFGLIDGQLAEKVALKLSKRIEQDGNLLNTGFLGTADLIPTLEKYGMRDQAMSILFSSDYPSWLYSIDQGATTMWERWNSYTKKDGFGDDSMNSFNHYAYGAVGRFFYESLAGLAPSLDKPGYQKIIVKPILDQRVPLEYAKASIDTRYGMASNGWIKTPQGWQVTTVIPANSSGKIVFEFELENITVIQGEVNFENTLEGSVALVSAGSYQFLIKG